MQSASWSWACNCCSAGCRYSSSTHANAAPPVGSENNSYCAFTLVPSVTLVAAVSCLLCVSNTCFPCLLKNNRHDCFMTLTCHVGHCAWSKNWTSVCGQACAEWINEKRFKILSATRSLKIKKSCSCNILPSGGASVNTRLFSLPVDGADEHIWRSNQWIWSETDSGSRSALHLTLVFLFAIQSSYFTLEEEEKKTCLLKTFLKFLFVLWCFCIVFLFLYNRMFWLVFLYRPNHV